MRTIKCANKLWHFLNYGLLFGLSFKSWLIIENTIVSVNSNKALYIQGHNNT
jgi:hypothetical protein